MAGVPCLPPPYYSFQPPPAALNIDTVEEGEPKCDDGAKLLISDLFEDKTTRLIFIQKVLTIKLLQLLGVAVVMGCCFATVIVCCYHRWVMYHNTVHFIVTSLIAYLVVFILLICCDQGRRQKPYKYIFLVACPLSIALFISSVTYWNAVIEVAMAWVYHCVAVFALLVYNIFVMRTKFDFDTLHGFYITTGVQVVLYALSVPFMYVDALYVLYPTIVLALEHLYLLFALKLMTSKTYKTALTPDDYVDAALSLHIDYIYILNKFLVPMIRSAWAHEIALLDVDENDQS